MPRWSPAMETTASSQPELGTLASESSPQTAQNTSEKDERLCLDGNGSPYLAGGLTPANPSPLTLPSISSPSSPFQRNLYGPPPPDSSFSSLHSPSPVSSTAHLEPGAFASQFSSGAFRSLSAPNAASSAEPRNGFHGSAFLPASRCLQNPKLEPGLDAGCVSPQIRSTLSIKQEEPARVGLDDSTRASDPNSSSDRITPDDNCRSLRKLKKRTFSDNLAPCCPVCGVTVRPSELPTHFHHEVCRLEKVAKSVHRPSRENTPLASPSGSKGKDPSAEPNTPESRWEAYERIKNNRNGRLTARANRGKKKSEETSCPVCSEKVSGTPEELNAHVEMCLKKQKEGNSSEDEPVDVEGDEEFEEYEWGGETRIRATSLVSGGLASLGFQTCKKNSKDEDEDLDLNVDGDDTATFGQPQYSEADVIPCRTDVASEDKAREELRQAVIRTNESSTNSGVVTTSKWESNAQDTEGVQIQSEIDRGDKMDQVISSLKQRIAELEAPNVGKLKCLICMEPYAKPVVSICCWHVHCEECWLRTLGVKKLCPQCNTITSPTDLRVVFL